MVSYKALKDNMSSVDELKFDGINNKKERIC
jgi:hypothetical protein